MEGQNFQFFEQIPTRIAFPRICNNSDYPFLEPKNVDTLGRLAPEDQTIGHYRVKR
jgi:hypothetical protein